MRIPIEEIKAGDILIFKGGGLVFNILGTILKVCEPKWDRWGWHTAFVAYWNKEWRICESIAEGIVISPLGKYKPENIRAYRWFDTPPKADDINRYLSEHLGKRYDVAIYFWTGLQYLVRHFWNRRIPRLLDDRYTCWENCCEFAECMGKPLHSKYDCPIITDMLTVLEE